MQSRNLRQFLTLSAKLACIAIAAWVILLCIAADTSGEPLREQHSNEPAIRDASSIFIERLIADPEQFFGWSINKKSLVASPNGTRFAFHGINLNNQRNKPSLVYDGNALQMRDKPIGPVFSPDSKHIAFLYTGGFGQWYMKIDQNTSKCDSPISKPIFTPDSARVGYWARVGKRQFFVDNGNRHHTYESVRRDTLTCSPGSERWAYVAKHDGQWCVVVNDIPGPGYEDIGQTIAFSRDNTRLAYWAKRTDGLWVIVINGKEKLDSLCRDQSELVFSPDSNRLAYFAKRNANWSLVINDREVRTHQWVNGRSLTFSSDATRLAYVAGDGTRQYVVLNGEAGPAYQKIDPEGLQFSPDANKLAFIADVGEGQCVVVNNDGSEVFESVSQLTFSPDSSSIAWIGERDGRYHVIVNGIGTETAFDFIIPGSRLSFVDNTRVQVAGYLNESPESSMARLEVDTPQQWAAVETP